MKSARRQSRELALQALYAWQVSGGDPMEEARGLEGFDKGDRHFVEALVAVGAVIRGETYHFEVVANESARGLMDVALESGLPIANGILTTEDEAQAEARLDKGAEAVRVALEMAQLRRSVDEKR